MMGSSRDLAARRKNARHQSHGASNYMQTPDGTARLHWGPTVLTHARRQLPQLTAQRPGQHWRRARSRAQSAWWRRWSHQCRWPCRTCRRRAKPDAPGAVIGGCDVETSAESGTCTPQARVKEVGISSRSIHSPARGRRSRHHSCRCPAPPQSPCARRRSRAAPASGTQPAVER